MQRRLRAVARVLDLVSRSALWIAGAGLVLMTGIVALQVFSRYVLNASPSWTEPLAVMLMGWFIFLGAAVGVREGFHMGFDVLLHVLPPAAAPWLRSISDAAILAFGLGMTVYGLQLIVRTWTATLPVLGLPGGFSYMSLTAGGLLISLFTVERLALRLTGAAPDHDPNAENVAMNEV